MAETRKILELGEEVGISATCARVPVVSGHSESINVQTREDLSPEDCRARCSPKRPASSSSTTRRRRATRLAIDAAGRDDVLVGRDPPRPRPRAQPQPLGRRRQPAQGRRHQRRPGGRAAGRARPAPTRGVAAVDIGFGEAVLLFGGLLAVVAALSGLMRGTVLSASVLSVALGIAARRGRRRPRRSDRPVDRRAGRAGADPHPLLRRDVRRARAAAPALEPGGALAGDRDADHDGAARAGGEGALRRPQLGRGLPARRGALADRPGGHLGRRHLDDWCRARSATRSTSSPASTTGSRCPSSSSSSSSPRPAGTPAPKPRSWSARRSSARRRHRPRGARRAPAPSPAGRGLTARYEGIYAVGFALVAFGLADVTIGNGLIAAFVCGIAMGVDRARRARRASSSSPRTPARSSRCSPSSSSAP